MHSRGISGGPTLQNPELQDRGRLNPEPNWVEELPQEGQGVALRSRSRLRCKEVEGAEIEHGGRNQEGRREWEAFRRGSDYCGGLDGDNL
jgi:hypothetical protein